MFYSSDNIILYDKTLSPFHLILFQVLLIIFGSVGLLKADKLFCYCCPDRHCVYINMKYIGSPIIGHYGNNNGTHYV